jgi:hypothetical protein
MEGLGIIPRYTYDATQGLPWQRSTNVANRRPGSKPNGKLDHTTVERLKLNLRSETEKTILSTLPRYISNKFAVLTIRSDQHHH